MATFGGKFYEKGNKLFAKGKVVDAVEAYKEGMESGDVLCKCMYARRLQQGWGVLPNKGLSYELFLQANNDLGTHTIFNDVKDGDVHYCFGLSYMCAEIPTPFLAQTSFEKGAELGNLTAMETLAEYFFNDKYVSKDIDASLQWGLKAIENGSDDVYLTVAKCYFDLDDKKNFAKYISLAEKRGSNFCLYNLAACYRKGNYVEKNSEKAAKLLKKVGKDGDSTAMTFYADMLREGEGIKADPQKANEILLSLVGVEVEAINLMGYGYAKGLGVAKDEKIAMKYYKQGKELGHKNSEEWFDHLFAKTPEGKAKTLVEQGENGDAQAFYKLGVAYRNGNEVKKDGKKALEYFKKSADMGDKKGQLQYVLCFKEGIGTKQDLSKHFNLALEYANQGNELCMEVVGICFDNGRGVKKDDKKATEWFKKSADLGNYSAMKNLALNYENGRGVAKDVKKAIEWYKKAVDNGSVDACGMLATLYCQNKDFANGLKYANIGIKKGDVKSHSVAGEIYYKGLGVTKDVKKAKQYLQIAADGGYTYASEALGEIHLSGADGNKDYTKARKCFEVAAQQDNKDAIGFLGDIYRKGLGVKVNHAKAVEWYKKGRDLNDGFCQYWIAKYYEGYEGAAKVDYPKALEWYKKAIENGYIYASKDVAWCYWKGKGTTQNLDLAYEYFTKAINSGDKTALGYMGDFYEEQSKYDEAFKWYLRSATECNDSTSQNTVGFYYEYGKGVAKNLANATAWYVKAAQNGNDEACANAGYMYESGLGVKQDYATAVKYYKMGAERGNARAQYNLSLNYSYGRGVKQDHAKSARYLKMAADQGVALAQYNLGVHYTNGYGVEQNDYTAVHYYTLAAKQGEPHAQYNLAVSYDYGCGIEKNKNTAIDWYKKAAAQGHKEAKRRLAELGIRS